MSGDLKKSKVECGSGGGNMYRGKEMKAIYCR